MKLFESYTRGEFRLKNKIVMAPMTRSRAIDNLPNDLMAEYYGQRADAGLLITEGVAPSANGLGYARIPGVYSEAQVAAWKKVTAAVHAKGGKIFMQLMHTGRASHPANMEEGTRIVAPSAIVLSGEIHTDAEGMQAYPVPEAMSAADIAQTQEDFVSAAKNAIAAGFDGVELHAANGYLMDQFLNPASNQRTDAYGGNAENRARFVIEVAKKVVAAIGADKTGIRLSPYGRFNDMDHFDGLEEAYTALAENLGKLDLVYLHISDLSSMGPEPIDISPVMTKMKAAFGGSFILSGAYNKERAEDDLQADKGDLVSFGRPFISNPDLVSRMKNDLELSPMDFDTFYTPGEKGYTDYPLAALV